MNEIKDKWNEQSPAVRWGIVAGAVLVGLLFVWKLLPLLIGALGLGVLIAILFIPYWIPTIVAFMRKHPSKGAIFALNFFFGWTFIGWVLCLVWALSDNSTRTQQIVVNTVVSPNINMGGNSVHTASPAPPPPSVPQYQIGDVVNNHRFNGVSWEPLEIGADLPPVPVRAPAQGPRPPERTYRYGS